MLLVRCTEGAFFQLNQRLDIFGFNQVIAIAGAQTTANHKIRVCMLVFALISSGHLRLHGSTLDEIRHK